MSNSPTQDTPTLGWAKTLGHWAETPMIFALMTPIIPAAGAMVTATIGYVAALENQLPLAAGAGISTLANLYLTYDGAREVKHAWQALARGAQHRFTNLSTSSFCELVGRLVLPVALTTATAFSMISAIDKTAPTVSAPAASAPRP